MAETREQIMERLLKGSKTNLVSGTDDSLKFERIPFGVPSLDKMCGGGVPTKRMTLLTGQTNGGKTFLAMMLAKQVIESGGLVGWADSEMTWDEEWARRNGVDPNFVMVEQAGTGEESLNAVKYLLESGDVDLVVLDSVAGLVPEAVDNEEFGYNPISWQARFFNSSLPKLIKRMRHGAAFVVINQVRSSMGPVALTQMPGGMGQQFFNHMMLEVHRRGWIEEGDKKVGFEMEVRLRKSKVKAEAWEKVKVPFRVDGGIDIMEVYIKEMIDAGLIKKSAAWYAIEGVEKKAQGINGVKEVFLADEVLYNKLVSNLEGEYGG